MTTAQEKAASPGQGEAARKVKLEVNHNAHAAPAANLVWAIETTRRALISGGLSKQLDDATIASRFPGIIGALVVAAAIEALRQEVAE